MYGVFTMYVCTNTVLYILYVHRPLRTYSTYYFTITFFRIGLDTAMLPEILKVELP